MLFLHSVPFLSPGNPPKSILQPKPHASATWSQHTLTLSLPLCMSLPCHKHHRLMPAGVPPASVKAMHLRNSYGMGPFPTPLPARKRASGL